MNNLPPEIIDIIFFHLNESTTFKDVLNARLLSKSWMDCFHTTPSSISNFLRSIETKQSQHLTGVKVQETFHPHPLPNGRKRRGYGIQHNHNSLINTYISEIYHLLVLPVSKITFPFKPLRFLSHFFQIT